MHRQLLMNVAVCTCAWSVFALHSLIRMVIFRVLSLTLVSLTLAAAATANDAAHLAFDRGDFKKAFQLVESDARRADRLAFQSRALLAECLLAGRQPEADALIRAEKLAREALDLAPDHVEGRLQLALSLSLQAKPMSLGELDRSGYGERSREIAESILEDEPENAYAHGFLAVWHVEARRKGGMLIAQMIGAKLSDARHHFEAAMKADPDNLILKWQYVRALMAFDARRFREEIEALQNEIESGTPHDQLERSVQARSNQLQPLIADENFRAAEALAASLL